MALVLCRLIHELDRNGVGDRVGDHVVGDATFGVEAGMERVHREVGHALDAGDVGIRRRVDGELVGGLVPRGVLRELETRHIGDDR